MNLSILDVVFCQQIWRNQQFCLKLCYLDKNSFIVYIKADDIYKDTVKDDGTRFDTSNYELGRPLPKGKY